jgi:hypothetical protein
MSYVCVLRIRSRPSKGQIGLRKNSPNVVLAKEKLGVVRLNWRLRTLAVSGHAQYEHWFASNAIVLLLEPRE